MAAHQQHHTLKPRPLLTCDKPLLKVQHALGKLARDLGCPLLHRVGPLAQLPLLQLDDGQQLRPLLLPLALLPLTKQASSRHTHQALLDVSADDISHLHLLLITRRLIMGQA